MKPSIDTILQNYRLLLNSVDSWFARAASAAGDAVRCGKGCSACCRGLFDITLLDALFLRQSYDKLSPSVQEVVLSRVLKQRDALQLAWPELSPPNIINFLTDEDLSRLMPEDDPTPCPLLGEDNLCLVYENRPMTCRLHGIPLVDISGEFFHDEWCTCNFKDDDPLDRADLRWEFRKCFEDELRIFNEFTGALLNQKINELDTLLPLAILIDFEGFDWKGWWEENSGKFKNGGFPDTHSSLVLRD